MKAQAASQWGVGVVLHRYRRSTRTKHERVLIVYLLRWRWEWRWNPKNPQLNLFDGGSQ